MQKILLITIACCVMCTMGMSMTTGQTDPALMRQCMRACEASQSCSDMHMDRTGYCNDATAHFADASVWQCVSTGADTNWDVTLADCAHN